MNNEYLDDVTGLEAEGYLQQNSDDSTDTWAPKLPHQCVADPPSILVGQQQCFEEWIVHIP